MNAMNDTIELDILAAPILEERPWAVFAACRDAEPSVFFSGSRADERSALALCSTCTVRADCLDHALEVRERFGVWGGTTEQDRRRILRMGA